MENPFALESGILEQLYASYVEAVDSYNWHADPGQDDLWPEIVPISSSQFRRFVETAFWASLKQEEGRFHEFSLLVHPLNTYNHRFVFNKPLKFSADHLAKLAPALDPAANGILVWPDHEGELLVRGFAPLGDMGLAATTIAPGQIIVSFKQIGMLHFTALISGTRLEFVGVSEFLTWLVPEAKDKRRIDVFREDWQRVRRAIDYRDIAADMRAHQHGGALLMVDPKSDWRESFSQPITFSGEPYSKVWFDVAHRDQTIEELKSEEPLWTVSPRYRAAIDSTRKSLRTIGQLTAVDGATLISYDLEVLAFGAKIKPRGADRPTFALISEPFKDSAATEIPLAALGGTRHQSAAQFVYDQRNALAFVASQDGRLSAMRWDLERSSVAVIRPAEFALL